MFRRTLKEELSEPRIWMVPFLMIICIPASIINYFSTNKWFCTFWSWYKTPQEEGFDGCSSTSICPRCEIFVLQDSQGNWF